MSRLALLLALAACVPPDPPVRSMVDTPYAPSRDLPFQTERQVADAVRDALAVDGLPHIDELAVQIVPQDLLPCYDTGSVIASRFLVGPPGARAALAQAGQLLTGAPLSLSGWSDPDIETADLALQIAWLSAALGNAASSANQAHDRGNAWIEDRRALDLAWPVLSALVVQSQLPASALSLYPRLLTALLDSLPPDARAHIPTDPDAAEAAYNTASGRIEVGKAPSDIDEQIAVGLKLRYALATTAQPAQPLDLAHAFAPDPQATLHHVAAGLASPELAAHKIQWKVKENHLVGWLDGTPLEFGLDIDEANRSVEGWLWQALPVPPAREPDVLRMVNLANLQHGPTRMELQKDRLVLYAPARPASDDAASAAALSDLLKQAGAWFDPIARLSRGELTLDAAKRAAMPADPKEGG